MTTQTSNPCLSLYPNSNDTSNPVEISMQDFLDGIAIGRWKKEVDLVRAKLGDKEAYSKQKRQTPCVTVAGSFNVLKGAIIREPSGKMAIDIDDIDEDLETVRMQINADQYTYACFQSIGGKGLCVIINVLFERWEESWEGAKLYYLEKYGRVVDKNTGNINRTRYVSHDEKIKVNEKASLFKLYPKKERRAPKPPGFFVHTNNDVEYVLEQIQQRAVDLTADYDTWYKMGFALISEYGENARPYFHTLSQYHPKYRYEDCDKTFSYLLRYGSRQITIKTFYYHAKLAGLETMTPQTRDIARTATMQKRQKLKPDDVIDSLVKVGGVGRELAAQVVKQVYESTEEIQTDDTLFDQIELFLRGNYNLRYNEITHYIENNGVALLDKNLNSIYIATAKVLDEKVRKDDVFSVLFSEFVPNYNPLRDFLRRYSHRKPFGVIDTLAATITHDTPGTNYVHFFLRKFLVGMIGTIHGEQCPLVPVLTGPPNTGKTQFWRRLLPDEISAYYGESNFNSKESDDEMKMCKKLLLMNDEFTGDLLVKHGKFKSLTDKQSFFIRKPYGKSLEDIQRLAMIAGTSNEEKILSDPTGNRRIIPITVLKIDHEAYNAIDKIDLLMEAYHLYMDGERGDLTNEQIAFLEKHTGKFIDISTERDMIDKYFAIPTNKADAMLYSQGEVYEYLNQVTGIKQLKKKLLSQEMKAMGFPYSDGDWYPMEGRTKRGFWLYKRTVGNDGSAPHTSHFPHT